jgi:hypothetical protein
VVEALDARCSLDVECNGVAREKTWNLLFLQARVSFLAPLKLPRANRLLLDHQQGRNTRKTSLLLRFDLLPLPLASSSFRSLQPHRKMKLALLLPLALAPTSLASAIYKPSSHESQTVLGAPSSAGFEMEAKAKWEDSPGTGHLSQWSRQNKVRPELLSGFVQAERG